MKDKEGNEIIEETIINADGTKQVIRKKVVLDKHGNQTIEEESTDSNGYKVTIKTKRGVNGEVIVEEIKVGANGKTVRTIK